MDSLDIKYITEPSRIQENRSFTVCVLFILIALLFSRLEYLEGLDLEGLGLDNVDSFRSGENAISKLYLNFGQSTLSNGKQRKAFDVIK